MSAGGRDSDLIVCRCEEIGLGALCDALDLGDTTVDAVKLRTRAGMGVCQGRSCLRAVQSLLRSRYPDATPDLPKQRWPVRPVARDGLSRPLDTAPELQIPLMELDLEALEGEG